MERLHMPLLYTLSRLLRVMCSVGRRACIIMGLSPPWVLLLRDDARIYRMFAPHSRSVLAHIHFYRRMNRYTNYQAPTDERAYRTVSIFISGL